MPTKPSRPSVPTAATGSISEQAVTAASVTFLQANAARRHAEGGESDLARFGKALDRQKQHEEAQRANKEEMLGGDLTSINRTRNSDDAKIEFFPRPPKLGALPELMYEFSVSSMDANSQVQLVYILSTTFLYVFDASLGQRRRATVDEIEEYMDFSDLDLLTQLCSRYTGITMDKLAAAKK